MLIALNGRCLEVAGAGGAPPLPTQQLDLLLHLLHILGLALYRGGAAGSGSGAPPALAQQGPPRPPAAQQQQQGGWREGGDDDDDDEDGPVRRRRWVAAAWCALLFACLHAVTC